MKNLKKMSVLAIILLAFCTLLYGCIEPMLSIDTELSMKVGDVYTIVPELNGLRKASLEWSSSNEDVAEVDENGVVTAIAPGTTVITVVSGRYQDSCAVTVTRTELDTAKLEAISDLESYISSLSEDDYDAEEWAEIGTIVSQALDAISDAEILAEVNEILVNAITDIDKVFTSVEKLEKSKTDAVEALQNYFNELSEDDYDAEEWAEIGTIVSQALDAISDAEIPAEVNEILANAITDIDKVFTSVEKFDNAQKEAIEYLTGLINGESPVSGTRHVFEEWYTGFAWSQIIGHYNTAVSEINSAAGYNAIDTAVATAVARIGAIDRMPIEDYAFNAIMEMFNFLDSMAIYFSAYIFSALDAQVIKQIETLYDAESHEQIKELKDAVIYDIEFYGIRIIDEMLGHKNGIPLDPQEFPGWEIDYMGDYQWMKVSELFAALSYGVDNFDDKYYNALIHFMTRAFINFDSADYIQQLFPSEFPEIYETAVTLFLRISDQELLRQAVTGAIWWEWAWSLELFQFIMSLPTAHPGMSADQALEILSTYMYNQDSYNQFYNVYNSMDFTELLNVQTIEEFTSVFATFATHYQYAYWAIDWNEDLFLEFTVDLKGGELFGSTENIVLYLRIRDLDNGYVSVLQIWDQWSADFQLFLDILANGIPTKGDIAFLGWRISNDQPMGDLWQYLSYLSTGYFDPYITALWDEKVEAVDPRFIGVWQGDGNIFTITINEDATFSRRSDYTGINGWLKDNEDGSYTMYYFSGSTEMSLGWIRLDSEVRLYHFMPANGYEYWYNKII